MGPQGRMDCFVALLLAMTSNSNMTPRSRGAMRPSCAKTVRPEIQRAQGMPGARCARGLVCKKTNTRVSHHGHTGTTRHSPRNGFTAYFALSPVTRLV